MREGLSRAAEYMNRREADSVARSTALPPDAPASAVTVLTTVARGGLLWLGIAVALAARQGHARRAARDGIVAVTAASASSHLIGWCLPRRRPPTDGLPAHQALIFKPTSSSFPSAHTATAAAFTTAIAWESLGAGLVVAPVALAVAYSRLRTRAHWPSDVVAGALWGVTVGVATRRLLRRRAAGRHRQVTALHGIRTAPLRCNCSARAVIGRAAAFTAAAAGCRLGWHRARPWVPADPGWCPGRSDAPPRR